LQFSLISPVEQNVILRSALSKAQQVVALSISATLKNSSGFDHTVNSSYNDGVFECLRTGAFCPQASTEVNAILDSDGKILYHKTSQFSFDLSGKTCNQPGVSPCLL